MVQPRQIAYKVWINDILKGEYHKEEGEWDPNYVLIKDKKVSRVNLIATVVDIMINDEINSGNIEIDDGSGNILVRAWKEDVGILRKVKIGDLILLVGRLRQFNNQNYITPEIIKVLKNIEWAKIRRLELEKEYGKLDRPLQEIKVISRVGESSEEQGREVMVERVEVPSVSESKRQKILNLIGKEEEANYDNVILEAGIDNEEASRIINELLREGEIYQSRPGYLKAI